MDKGLTGSGLSSLRSRIMGEWKSAAGDLSKLKETGTASKGTPSADGTSTVIAVNSSANPVPPEEPTTTAAATEPIFAPVEEVEDTANGMLDGAKKHLDKIKIPKFKW